MKALNKLLKGYPNSIVEWKSIEEIATNIFRGRNVYKSQLRTGNYPCIWFSDVYDYYEIWIYKCVSGVNPKLIKNPIYINHGDIFMVSSSLTLKDVGKFCAYLGNEKPIVGGDILAFSHRQNPKYLAYALSTSISKKQIILLSKESVRFHISVECLKKVKIPVPSLKAQERIAEILDRIRIPKEDIVRKLKKEIEEREKQYEYYRDLILTTIKGGLGIEFQNARWRID